MGDVALFEVSPTMMIHEMFAHLVCTVMLDTFPARLVIRRSGFAVRGTSSAVFWALSIAGWSSDVEKTGVGEFVSQFAGRFVMTMEIPSRGKILSAFADDANFGRIQSAAVLLMGDAISFRGKILFAAAGPEA